MCVYTYIDLSIYLSIYVSPSLSLSLSLYIYIYIIGQFAPGAAHARTCFYRFGQSDGRSGCQDMSSMSMPLFIGPADCNHCNCSHICLVSLASFNKFQYRIWSNLWLQLQWLQSAGPSKPRPGAQDS